MFRRRFGGSGKRQIERVVRSIAEKKYNDLGKSFTNNVAARVSYTGNIYFLNQIDQGQTDTTRIGDKVTGTSLQVNFMVVNPGYFNDTALNIKYIPLKNYYLRIIIFIWKDDLAPTVNDIIDGGSPDEPRTAGILGFLDHDRKVKRKVIMDEVFNLYCDTTSQVDGTSEPTLSMPYTGSYKPNMFIRRAFDLTKLRGGLNVLNFVGSTNVDPVNGIYMLLISNTHQDNTPTPAINDCWNVYGSFRYNFIDM